jgi:hypothetical protein
MQACERQGGELLLRKFCLLGYRRYWGNLVSEAGGFPLELLDLQLPVLMRNSRGGALSQQLSRAGIRHIPLLDRLARSICEVISKRCFGRIVGKPEPTIFASSNFRLARDSPGSPESAEKPSNFQKQTIRINIGADSDILAISGRWNGWKIKCCRCSAARSLTSLQERFSCLWDWQLAPLLQSVDGAGYASLSG